VGRDTLLKKVSSIQVPVPISRHGLGFLRALRALRLFRSHRIVSRMKRDFLFVMRNYDTVIVETQLFVFLFVTIGDRVRNAALVQPDDR
jgi:voltage-gated potassium channel